ncbi:MAG: hypothetical protein ABL984_11180 [Pyrinomonadaceae bacterium]
MSFQLFRTLWISTLFLLRLAAMMSGKASLSGYDLAFDQRLRRRQD